MLHLYEAVNAVYGHRINENCGYNNPFYWPKVHYPNMSG